MAHAISLVLTLLLVFVVTWIAKKNHFFQLPPPSLTCPVLPKQAIGAFLTYLLFALFILPLVQIVMALLTTGDIRGIKILSQSMVSASRLISLCVIFISLILYCFLLKPETRRFIFWGEEEVSKARLYKSYGMGVVGWAVAYPFVLLSGVIGSMISLWIWGSVKVEQVAVKELKTTMSNPILFSFMIFAVVALVPFMEELLFRGFFQNLLKRYFGRWWAISITPIVFAFVHYAPSQKEGNFQLILSLAVLSFFLSFIYERERALWAPIALHMFFNGFSVLLIAFS